jgi:hypothetical protein
LIDSRTADGVELHDGDHIGIEDENVSDETRVSVEQLSVLGSSHRKEGKKYLSSWRTNNTPTGVLCRIYIIRTYVRQQNRLKAKFQRKVVNVSKPYKMPFLPLGAWFSFIIFPKFKLFPLKYFLLSNLFNCL